MKNVYTIQFQGQPPLRVVALNLADAIKLAQAKLNTTADPIGTSFMGAVDAE